MDLHHCFRSFRYGCGYCCRRGSMVLVLGLNPAMPNRSLLINMTFAVVLFSLVVQGLTIKTMIRGFGINDSQEPKSP